MKDHFINKAGSYEANNKRVQNVANIADTVIATIDFDPSMQLMDFGSGTGLLLERIAPQVKKISAVDISPSMMAQLLVKQDSIDCDLETLQIDLEKQDIDKKYDGIISSMTMHHIADIRAMFKKFYRMLNEGGFIAIADLDTEDGSFHDEDTGVHHFGFDRSAFLEQARHVGFKNLQITDANIINKPHADFGVFLLTAYK